MLDLKNITLIAFTSVRIPQTIKALEYSSRDINFGAIKLVSDISPDLSHKIQYEYTPKMSNIDEWNYSTIYELGKHVDTEFAILIHDDGFIVNPHMWRSEFLDYDYIGAPWPLPSDDFSYRDKDGTLVRVGNSVSLRSKRLIDLPVKENIPWGYFYGNCNEDGFICVNRRHIYQEHGMRFADIEVAKYFSHETMIPEIGDIEPFAFHKYHGTNNKYPNYGR